MAKAHVREIIIDGVPLQIEMRSGGCSIFTPLAKNKEGFNEASAVLTKIHEDLGAQGIVHASFTCRADEGRKIDRISFGK